MKEIKKLHISGENADLEILGLSDSDLSALASHMATLVTALTKNVVERAKPCGRNCHVGLHVVNTIQETFRVLGLISNEVKKRGLEFSEELSGTIGQLKYSLEVAYDSPVESFPEAGKKEVYH